MAAPDELVEAYSTNDAYEAEVLRLALQEEGIPCEIDGESQAALPGLVALEVKLLVRAEDLNRTRSFLNARIRANETDEEEEADDEEEMGEERI